MFAQALPSPKPDQASRTVHPGALAQPGFSDPAFGCYRVLARIGRGGMSDILLALREADEVRRVVVLKVLSSSLTTEPAASDMFLDEARVAIRLSHPNIVQTYDVGVFQGSYCIAMEYLRGQPLHRVLQRSIALRRRLPLTVCVSLIIDVLDALSYAHDSVDCDGRALNVVHRDISPQNLLLQYDGRIKVLDFGIAKASTQESATNAGVIKGKFAYMAPEQARAVPVDRRADLWSVGVVLWELCTGKRLFKCASEAETLQATLYAAIPKIAELRPEVPEELEKILHRALQRDPAHRYVCAREMQEALEHWLRAQPQYVRTAPALMMAELFAEERAQQERSVRLLLSRHTDSAVLPSSQRTFFSSATPFGTAVTLGEPSVTVLVEELRRKNRLIAAGAAAALLLALLATAAAFSRIGIAPPSQSAATGQANPTRNGPAPSDPAPTGPTRDTSAPATGRAWVALPSPAGGSVARPPAIQTPVAAPSAPPPSVAAASVTAGAAGLTRAARVASGNPSALDPARERQVAMGYLTLDTSPWSTVTQDGNPLGQTPLIRMPLPAGEHALVLTNAELGIKVSYWVKIEPGKTLVRRVGLE